MTTPALHAAPRSTGSGEAFILLRVPRVEEVSGGRGEQPPADTESGAGMALVRFPFALALVALGSAVFAIAFRLRHRIAASSATIVELWRS